MEHLRHPSQHEQNSESFIDFSFELCSDEIEWTCMVEVLDLMDD